MTKRALWISTLLLAACGADQVPELGRLDEAETRGLRIARETRQFLAGADEGRFRADLTLDAAHLVLAFGWRAEPEAKVLKPVTVSASLELANGSVHPLVDVELPPVPGEASGWREVTAAIPERLVGRTATLTVDHPGVDDASLVAAVPELISARGDRPDVILVSIDTLRSDRLGCYGYERPTSPAIDAMAREGTLFRNAIAHSSWTLPSHYSMLTSLYPSAHGVNPDRWQLTGIRDADQSFQTRGSGRERTLAEWLRSNGFYTAAITESGWVSPRHGFDQGFASYVDHGDDNLAEATQRMTLDWLRAHPDVPYFLFVHTYQTHLPYHQPPPYDSLFIDSEHVGYALPGVKLTWPIIDLFKNGSFPPIAGDVAMFSGLYDGEVRYVDAFLEAVLDELRQSGRDRRTILLFTSDHGEEIFERGRLDHGGTLYDEVLRVPFILWGPGRVPAGKTVETPVASVDILPTLVELATGTVPPEAGLQGRSLVSLLAGDGAFGDRALFAEGFSSDSVLLTSIWDGSLKAIFQGADLASAELFDLDRDPGETTDLAAERPQEIDRLRLQVVAWRQRSAAIRELLGDAEEILDEETEERLKALGYL